MSTTDVGEEVITVHIPREWGGQTSVSMRAVQQLQDLQKALRSECMDLAMKIDDAVLGGSASIASKLESARGGTVDIKLTGEKNNLPKAVERVRLAANEVGLLELHV